MIALQINEFEREQEHKQKLLDFAISKFKNIDWFIYLDPDEIFEKRIYEALPKLLKFGETFGIDGFFFHLINLWRSQVWYRVDSQFNDLWKCHIWRNNGKLRFDTTPGLHKPLHPLGLTRVMPTNIQVIHYGFSTVDLIVRKYRTYKALGQKGWALNRLIDERNLQLAPVNLQWFEKAPKIEPKPIALSQKEWLELVK